MKNALIVLMLSIALALLGSGTANASDDPSPTTGIPFEPALPGSLAPMPSEDELALLYALNQVSWAEVPALLVELGLDRDWWEENFEFNLHQIPSFLPESAGYNVFIDMGFLSSGTQTGCYVNAGSDDEVVCIDSWPAPSQYPLLADTSEMLDVLFPPAQYETFGGVGGEPVWMQWDCSILRDSSTIADTAAQVGFAGGAGAAVGAFSAGGGLLATNVVAGLGAAISAAAVLAGEGTIMAGLLAIAAGPIGAALVVGAVVGVAVIAGVTARKAYVAGMTPFATCPGCGEGVDPSEFTCVSNAASDLCTCTPVGDSNVPSGNEGSGGGGQSDDAESHGGTFHGDSSLPYWSTNTKEFSGCAEWESFPEDSSECDGCWEDEEEVTQPTTGESQAERRPRGGVPLLRE